METGSPLPALKLAALTSADKTPRRDDVNDLTWLNRGLWTELRKKKIVYDLRKKGQATQEDYKGVVRLYREKIGRAKAQLEISLATAIKDKKKCFYKDIRD